MNEAENLRAQIVGQLPKNFIPYEKQVSVLKCEFAFPYLKRHSKKKRYEMEQGLRSRYKTSRPDLDNLEKLIWDAMNGVVFTDDAIIVDKNMVRKIYHPIPHLSIKLEGE